MRRGSKSAGKFPVKKTAGARLHRAGSAAHVLSAARVRRFTWRAAAVWLNRSVVGVLLIGVAAGVAFGLAPLKERVGELRTAPITVEFNWPPLAGDTGRTWLNPEEQVRLGEMAHRSLAENPFDVASLESARSELASTGWYTAPPVFRRKPGGTITIDGDWRIPAGVARVGSWEYLVSQDGALLPIRYPAGAAGDLPVILNPYTGPPKRADGAAEYGAIWAGGDIPAAIALIEALRVSGHEADVAAIDVSRYVREGLLTIITPSGGRVVWGAPPGAGAPGEVTDAIKLERFEKLFSDPTWLGADRPPIEIFSSLVLIDESARP